MSSSIEPTRSPIKRSCYSQNLEDAVNGVKNNEERRLEYMTMMIHDMEIRAEGEAKSRAEGRDERSLEIFERLRAANIPEDQARAIAFG